MNGRVAVVTGAAGGIGTAVARALACQGATVVTTDLTGADLAVDVRDGTAVEAAVAQIEDRTGPVGILVNVAGVLRTGPVLESTDADWAEVFAVNLHGVVHWCRAVARRMVPRRSGVIVTVGSNAAGVPRMDMAAYAASKAAAAHFTRCLGLELSGCGIRCNVVAPGSTDTAMQRSMWGEHADPAGVVHGSLPLYRNGIPLGRIADPEDVADAVVFLASDRARHITMQQLYVDGGAALRG
jgi:2,3-dihydro-2,3-dihydroxybenzoate dehydrogenase